MCILNIAKYCHKTTFACRKNYIIACRKNYIISWDSV